MAEVKLDITAQDRATAVLAGVANSLGEVAGAAGRVKAAIDSIPEVSHKTVIVRYQTEASPIMPFTEGMEMIRAKMESLPTETLHTVRFEREGAEGGSPASNPHIRGAGGVTFSFGDIHINGAGGDGEALAREFQRALAEDILNDRSPVTDAIRRKIR